MTKKHRIYVRKRKGRKITNRKLKIRLILLAVVIIGVFSVLCYILREHAFKWETFTSNKYYVKGIDVSHHNPIINWEVAQASGITFAYLKATEGIEHEDRNYPYNYSLARATNINVGSYHFYSFGISGKEQATHFINISQCQSGDLIPAIDVEHSKANVYSKDPAYINSVVVELKILENALYEYYGVHPIIYTNRDCYKLYIKNQFSDNIIWMSDLQKEPSDDIQNWKIWQFSHNGEIEGIDGDIDLNYYRYSFKEFQELILP